MKTAEILLFHWGHQPLGRQRRRCEGVERENKSAVPTAHSVAFQKFRGLICANKFWKSFSNKRKKVKNRPINIGDNPRSNDVIQSVTKIILE